MSALLGDIAVHVKMIAIQCTTRFNLHNMMVWRTVRQESLDLFSFFILASILFVLAQSTDTDKPSKFVRITRICTAC